MQLTIDTEVLWNRGLTLDEFLVLLIGYYNVPYERILHQLMDAKVVQPNLFDRQSMVLSNNSKDFIARLIMESDVRIQASGIDFYLLAQHLQSIYPAHEKPGTTYQWRGNTYEIAQKLMTLFTRYNFSFNEEEAIAATQEYINSFDVSSDPNRTKMRLLKYFILRTDSADKDVSSPFMTIIENNRQYAKTNY